ncbi:MAG TPA: FAD-dependent oxidoreductase [Ktedonobacteraceae bacterium]|nr:FAD-dependent oxidoreductase [Ktedonobacteraceae bacterium]
MDKTTVVHTDLHDDTQPAQMKERVAPVSDVCHTRCCIIGSGPAGAFLALLLARQGIPVMLLEAHKSFERDFRGDTIHPAILEILAEIGLVDRLLQFSHMRAYYVQFHTNAGPVVFDDFRHLKTSYPYIMKLPQETFLEFLIAEAKQYPNFQLIMGARVEQLIETDGIIQGVRYRGTNGIVEVKATLTVGADGRFSRTRRIANLEQKKLSPPLDFLWFHLPRQQNDPQSEAIELYFGSGFFLVLLNRGEKWQVGCAIGKGTYQQVRKDGIETLQQALAACIPWLANRVENLNDWKQISLLSIESSRLKQWYRPGLLLIGDAAHVMSPIGSVGINLAIQDAVAAANTLCWPLQQNQVQISDLAAIQRQRAWRTRLVQSWTGFIQKQIVAALNARQALQLPRIAQFLLHLPLIRTIPARLIAFGGWSEHIRHELRQPKIEPIQ